jgi:stress-induced morphogen
MSDTPAFVQQLVSALTTTLRGNGLTAGITFEPVVGTKMYRFYVVSDEFAEMMHSERQSLVWRVVDQALQQADALKVSMILTLTRNEIGEPQSAASVG